MALAPPGQLEGLKFNASTAFSLSVTSHSHRNRDSWAVGVTLAPWPLLGQDLQRLRVVTAVAHRDWQA